MSSPSSPVTHAREVELRERELCLNIAAREREAEAALLLSPFCSSEAVCPYGLHGAGRRTTKALSLSARKRGESC